MKKPVLFHIPKQVSHTIYTVIVSTNSDPNPNPDKQQHVRMPKTSISDGHNSNSK